MTDLTDSFLVSSDQLNADDLISKDITIKITKVSKKESEKQGVSIHYEGDDGKPWKPCKTMGKILKQLWGTDGKAYINRYITLYRDPKTRFGGLEVGGIRISHMSHIEGAKTVVANESKEKKRAWIIQPLTVKTPAIPEDITALKNAGIAAADKGMDSLTEWKKSLTSAQKVALGKEFGEELTKIATNPIGE